MAIPVSPFHPADAADVASPDVPDFLPWFPKRRTTNGWSPDRQRGFLAALQACGSVRQAAAAVGKSARSAWQLRDKPGAEHFAVVWDEMARDGRSTVAQANFARAMHGELQPIYRGGRYRGIRLAYPDRIALGVLGADKASVDLLITERYRLDRWEIALRRREMDLDDTARRAALHNAEEHAIWLKEIAAEERRARTAEVRALIRSSRPRPRPPAGPRVRIV
jgi:hypothetical protein